MGLEKRKDGWYCSLPKSGGGRRYKKLKGCTTRRQAEAEYAVRLRRAERVAEGLEVDTKNPDNLTVTGLFELWFELKGRHLAGDDADQRRLKRYLYSDDEVADLRLEQVTKGVITRHLRRCEAGGTVHGKARLSPQTVRHIRALWSRVFGWAIEEERFFGENPARHAYKPKLADPVPVFLEREEIAALLALPDAECGEEMKNLYALAVFTGARRGELFGAEKVDVDRARRMWTIRRSGNRTTTKGGRARVVDLVDEVMPFVESQFALHPGSRYLFPGLDGGRRSEKAQTARRLREHLKKANIERPTFRFHDLRHTFASWWLMNGGTLEALQEILGHTSIELTRRQYGHLSRAFVRAQWARFSLAPTKGAPVEEIDARRRSKG